MNNFTDNLSKSFNISSLIIEKSENNKDIINLIQPSNKINLSETSDESSENESSEDESSDEESSDVSSDSSDCIDKTKGDENLGIILNGKYVLIEKIGYGTFSSVWLAYKFEDISGKHFYAIKVQHPEDYEDGMKEATYLEKIKKLNCPNIIYMYETFTFKPQNTKSDLPSVCMVFDLLVGSVYQLIKKGKYQDGLDEKIVAKIINQIANALNVIKEQLNACHTDIKPENILIKGTDKRLKIFMEKFLEEKFCDKLKILCDKIITDNKFILSNKKHKLKFSKIKKELVKKIIVSINTNINTFIEKKYNITKDYKIIEIDDNIQVVLADFGTIKPFTKIKYTDDIQTRYYRAPEVILMCNYDHKADIWSLACTAYELLTGSLLFDPEKDKYHSTDYHHIYWIIELLGDIPKSLLSKSKNSEEFFHSSGKFKEKKPELHPLSVIFKEDVKIDCSDKMINLLEKMLAVSPTNRFDYNDIINYIKSNY
jgi:serine/threonine protein kinase